MNGRSSGGSPGGHPLFRREGTKRSFSTMAESHRGTSPDTLFVRDDHYDNEHVSQRPRTSSRLALPSRPPHFPGDGLDFRRPVMSGSGNSSGSSSRHPSLGTGIIDLTEEDDSQETGTRPTSAPSREATGGTSRAQRGPRFGRDIIDLESDSEEQTRTSSPAAAPPLPRPNYLSLFPPRAPSTTHPHPRFSGLRRPNRTSPTRTEMNELNGTRTRHSRLDGETTRGHRSVTPYPIGATEPIDLTAEDDEVVFVETRTGVNAERPNTTAGSGTRSLFDRINDLRDLAGGGRLFGLFGERLFAGNSRTNANNAPTPAGGLHAHIRLAPPGPQAMPGMTIDLDFDVPAWDLRLEGGNRPAEQQYEPPPAAAKGFTRTPAEGDVLVCPNCGDELATSDDETKSQIWMIKKCGHTYCGTCARFRTKTARGKGKAPAHSMPMPFKECVVNGCREKAGSKAMMHVYIGS